MSSKRSSRASVPKMGIADDCAEIWGAPTSNSKVNMKLGGGIQADVENIFGSDTPQVTTFSSKSIEIQDNFMDEAQIDSNETKSSVGFGGGPDGEDPKDKKNSRTSEIKMTTALDTEKEAEAGIINENMIVDKAAVETISDSTRQQEKDFMNKYDEIRTKLEKEYGMGNGDYELEDRMNLYELMPERLPVDE